MRFRSKQVYVTISLGVHSLVPSSESNPELLIALADKALYQAKKEGRNRACLYSGASAEENQQ